MNYKFKQTKVASIFKDVSYAFFAVNTSFCRRSTVINKFNESLSLAEDMLWINTLLIDEQIFGVSSQPYYHYRERLENDSAWDKRSSNFSNYIDTITLCHLWLLNHTKEKYGIVLQWLQYTIMFELSWRIKERDTGLLTSVQKEEYRALLRTCLAQIEDQIILTVRNFGAEERLLAFALKYNMTYEQVAEWVQPDKEENALYFCRPDVPPLRFRDVPGVWVEFIDIVDNRLLLRGSWSVIVPRERTTLALTVALPDETCQEYPCALFRRPDQKKMTFFEEAFYVLESFEVSASVAVGATIRFSLKFDDRTFEELEWQHSKHSPFVRSVDASYFVRAGYIVGKLPNNKGLIIETHNLKRVQEREYAFLGQIIQRPAKSLEVMQVTRIRKAGRKMRRLSKRPIWLISDRIAFAGDNGEALFEYLMANPAARQDVRPIFVLSKNSEDWERLKQIGPTVADGSILHKVFSLAADKLIISTGDAISTAPFGQDDCFYRDLFNFDIVFLQHGVTKDYQAPWLNSAKQNFALFVTAAERERASIVEGDYGYTAEQVVLTGFPRHDKLLRKATVEKTQRLVAVMPTWRNNLVLARDPITTLPLPNPAFEASEYFQFWNGLLNHPRLLEALRDYGYRLRLAIHPQSAHEGSKFQAPPPVEVVFHCDYPQTFCEANLLLTDYSSVAFEFSLLKKPLIYTQFDYATFYSCHTYTQGYFEYERDGFGPVCPDLETTVDAVIHYLENGCEMEALYRERVDAFFGEQPENRCQAVVDAIKKLGRRPE